MVAKPATSTRLSDWASSIDVDARLTRLDPPGKPAARDPIAVARTGAARRHDRISSKNDPPPTPGRASAKATKRNFAITLCLLAASKQRPRFGRQRRCRLHDF